MNTKPVLSHNGSRRPATPLSAEKANGTSTPPISMERVISTEPRRARAMPTEQINTYFQVASRVAADRCVYISGALASVVASMAIHMTMI